MAADPPRPLRVLFCVAITQNFFDLPSADIPNVLKAFGRTVEAIAGMAGVTVLGTLDDDETMVGPSPTGWPWTCYILADVVDRDTVVAVCNLFRATQVAQYRLWRYGRIEARIGRELALPT